MNNTKDSLNDQTEVKLPNSINEDTNNSSTNNLDEKKIEQIKNEEIKIDIVNKVEEVKNLTLISNLTIPAIHLDKYLSFIENDDVKKIVKLLTSDMKSVNDILHISELILADGKIDQNDIPLLLTFVRKVVSLRGKDLDITKNFTTENLLTIIKITFTILIKEDVIKIKDSEKFLKDISTLIDMIIEAEKILETMNIGCSSWFSCGCFNKNKNAE